MVGWCLCVGSESKEVVWSLTNVFLYVRLILFFVLCVCSHLDNLKAHCIRLINAGASPSASASAAAPPALSVSSAGPLAPAASGAGVSGGAGVEGKQQQPSQSQQRDVSLAAMTDELENAFDECRQNFLDLSALCTEVLGRAMVKNTSVLCKEFFGNAWLKGTINPPVLQQIVEKLSQSYER